MRNTNPFGTWIIWIGLLMGMGTISWFAMYTAMSAVAESAQQQMQRIGVPD